MEEITMYLVAQVGVLVMAVPVVVVQCGLKGGIRKNKKTKPGSMTASTVSKSAAARAATPPARPVRPRPVPQQAETRRVYEDDLEQEPSVHPKKNAKKTVVKKTDHKKNIDRLQPRPRQLDRTAEPSEKKHSDEAIKAHKACREREAAMKRADDAAPFIEMGKVFFPLEIDDAAFRQNGNFPAEDVVLERLTYVPEKNERYNIGSEIDDIEYAPSEVSSIESTDDAVSQKATSKKSKKGTSGTPASSTPAKFDKQPPKKDDDKDGPPMRTPSANNATKI